MTGPDLAKLPGLAIEGDAPVFQAPWEAQAFGMVIHLHDKGAFTWEEWAACLSAEIHSGVERGYYEHWLKALETLVASKKLTNAEALKHRKDAWQAAAARTPHGDPIEL